MLSLICQDRKHQRDPVAHGGAVPGSRAGDDDRGRAAPLLPAVVPAQLLQLRLADEGQQEGVKHGTYSSRCKSTVGRIIGMVTAIRIRKHKHTHVAIQKERGCMSIW